MSWQFGGGMITRFAPSPTGYLHLGHAFSILNGWYHVQRTLGRYLLRFEDIDQERCRPEFYEAIQEDLKWLGVEWETPIRFQSHHFLEYENLLTVLKERGLLYPCFCSRKQIEAEWRDSLQAPHHAPDGSVIYPGTCKNMTVSEQQERLAAGYSHVWRLDMKAALEQINHPKTPLTWMEEGQGRQLCYPEAFGDVILARKDVLASYHLCVTYDDAFSAVDWITRGEDLRSVTSVHRVLQCLMKWPEPVYAHHILLKDETGQKFSKRHQSQTLRSLRDNGLTLKEIKAQITNYYS